MAASSGSGSSGTSEIETTSTPFLFPDSFTTLLTTTTTSAAVNKGSGIPKFKSFPPPSLPISQPSHFAIPNGLTSTDLLDSPVLLSASNILPSPTTGTFPIQGFNWINNNNVHFGDQDQNNISDFSFQTRAEKVEHKWDLQVFEKQNGVESEEPNMKSELNSLQNFPPQVSNERSIKSIKSDYNQYNKSSQNQNSDDGYNWRKYGQKQVKGSENPRSYFKCTYSDCPMKKIVEKTIDGHITEIVYKNDHNHPKPESARRSSSSLNSSAVIQPYQTQSNEIPDQSYGSNDMGTMDSLVGTPDNSSITIGDDEFEQTSQKRRLVGDECDEDELETKRWKGESENEGISAIARAVKEPRVVVQTISDIDILDDGYRWRKYGQKVVKRNPNPRSYYKCTEQGCPVRKHVERASHDARSVITTYEGKHNHDVPVARGRGGSHSISRPMPNNYASAATNNTTATNTSTRPSLSALPYNMSNYSVPMPMPMPMPMSSLRPQSVESSAPYTLEMLQNTPNFGYLSQDNNAMFSSRPKEELRDDVFLDSFMY